jgi:hypothetical protein
MQSSLPVEIRLLVLGILSTVLLLGGAAWLRGAPYGTVAVAEAARPRLAATGSASARAVSAAPAKPGAAPGSASPSAARAAAPPPEAPALGGDAREARAALTQALQLGRYPAATDALARLLEMDPRAVEDGEVRGDVVELSMRVMLQTGGDADRVFDMITTKMGAPGIDILYELVTTRGGSRAAARADDVLKDPAVRARGTPALRITYDLRVAHGCDEKKALFGRATTDGDRRSLGQLQQLKSRCGRRSSACCFENDPDLQAALDAINARLK